MKMLLILWAIGLSQCEKLDRTYLPPPSSITAGGQTGDLNLPLEFTRKYYSSTLDPIITTNGSISSKYPNIALGIDRQSPYVTASPTFSTNQPGISVTKYSTNVPVGSYSGGQTTSLPVGSYDPTIGPTIGDFQRYSTMSPSFEPILNYEQDLIQQITKPLKSSQSINAPFASRDPVTNIPNQSIGQSSKYEFVPETSGGRDDNVQQSPTFQYPTITSPTADIAYPNKFYNEKSVDRNSQRFNNPINTGEIINDPAVIDTAKPSYKYSSLPTNSKDIYDARYKINNTPQREQTESDRNAVILNYENILTPEGFAYSFDTSNGIHADESGTAVDGVRAKGSYSYVGDDGKIYNIEYTADENGYQPRGNHLPTAPPVPEAILKGIEEAEKNRKLGIIDDGSYDDAKYGHGRYQGLMGRIPLNKYKDFIQNQPDLGENEEQREVSFDKEDLPTDDNVLDTIKYDFGAKSKSPDKYKISGVYDIKYPIDDMNVSPNSDDVIRLKGRLSTSKGNTFNESSVRNSEIFDPVSIGSQKKYNGDDNSNQYQSGYDYSTPQNMFRVNEKNRIPNVRINDETNFDEEQRESTTAKTFVTPNAFNFKNRMPDTNSQLLKKKLNDPTVTGNDNGDNIQNIKIEESSPNTPLFYNKGPGQNQNVRNFIPEFSTQEPKYASTTLRPYYQPAYTVNGNTKQRTNYPSSALASDYSGSTTPLPSEFSSSFIPSTSNVNYSETTPSISQFTSTFRPSISTGRPTSDTTSRPSGYMERISEPGQVGDSRISTIKPISFGQRTIQRPGYEGRPNKFPVNQNGLSKDLTPGFEVSDPRTQNLRVSSRPENFGGQSSTETVFGEDFRGPKQPQKFDPKYGYFY